MKQIKLLLGGKERDLDFGKIGFFTHVKETTGKDPLEWLKEIDEKIEKKEDKNFLMLLLDDVVVLTYAGLNTSLDEKDEANVPIEKVKKWCNGLSISDISLVVRTALYTEALEAEPGEAETQAANP